MNKHTFCEWCGQPALEGSALCPNCYTAQQQVERGEMVTTSTGQPQTPTAGARIVQFFFQLSKAMAAGLMSLIAIGAAMIGTCSIIGAVFGGGAGLILPALIGMTVLALMLWLIYVMYKSDISPPPRSLPARLPYPADTAGQASDEQPPSTPLNQDATPPEGDQSSPPMET